MGNGTLFQIEIAGSPSVSESSPDVNFACSTTGGIVCFSPFILLMMRRIM